MEAPILEIDPKRVEDLIFSMGRHGAVGDTGVSRTTYSPAWVAANAELAMRGADAGLTPRMDAVGNLWLRAEGQDGGKVIATGSHVDSQCPGGRYDGVLGIIAGLIAVEALIARHGAPRRPIEVVSLCEEEGSRFPTAAFWGSRGVTGRILPDDVTRIMDLDGIPIGQAMQDVGLDPERAAEARRDDLAAFLELHIEQGPVLEAAGLPVAVVDAITSIRHREIELTGVANHAGAFPMRFRRDPMAGFAEICSGVVDHAHRLGAPAVSTIGRIEVDPNGAAIVPKRVTFTLDSRHPDQSIADEMAAAQERLMTEIAARRGLGIKIRTVFNHDACACDPALVATLKAAASKAGTPYITMASGAGHDSQQMASLCPVAMIFVRSKDGRSHTPEEFSSVSDIVAGIQVLAGALYRLAWAADAATATEAAG